MTQEELQKMIAQMYGNVLTAGQELTANAAPIPTANVAGIDPLLGKAGNVAANIASGAQGYFDKGSGFLSNVSSSIANASTMANASTAAYDPSSYQAYMDPYQQEVIDKYSQEMQRQFDVSQQQRAGQAIGAGAFGGGREGVYQAEGLRGFQEQLGSGIAGLLSKGYGQAQTMAQQNFADQMKRLQGAAGIELAGGELGMGTGQSFGQLGTQYGGTMGGVANTMAQIGVTGQQAQQDIYNQQYQNQMARYLQPYQQLQFQAGLLGGVAPSYFQSPASQQGNPLLAGIGALGGFAR